jgi:hypothetical protein
MITIHHIKEYPIEGADLHLYCGRETSFKPKENLINAKLGNPFIVGKDYSRGEAVEAYRENVPDKHWPRIERLKELNKQKHVALYCFCKPLACHCDVIKELCLKPKQPKTR